MVGITQATTLAKAHASFACTLYQGLRGTGEGNLVISPFSTSAALAMTLVGARGSTAKAMRESLGLSGIDEPDAGFMALREQLRARERSGALALRIANALWTNRGEQVADAFVHALASSYAAHAESLDFSRAPEQARVHVNAWVAGETEGQIAELLSSGACDGVSLLLTNAVYFRGTWRERFNPLQTQDMPFRSGARELSVPTMTQSLETAFAEHPQWTAIELPYVGDQLSMALYLPKRELAEFEAALDPAWFAPRALGQSGSVQLWLPRFSIEWAGELKAALCELGMAEAFDARADFSGISPGLFISKVCHAVRVKADEEGTVAAAATAVAMTRSRPRKTLRIAFDRPFFFVIRDRPTGALLFMGRVVDPRACVDARINSVGAQQLGE